MAGLDQATNTPPEWQQGFVVTPNDSGLISGSPLSEQPRVMGWQQLSGKIPRTTAANATAYSALPPRGDLDLDGASRRRWPSRLLFPALVAPYAVAAVSLRLVPEPLRRQGCTPMGNYSLLESAGGNIALEFLYSGPHSLFSRMHLNNTLGAPTEARTNE